MDSCLLTSIYSEEEVGCEVNDHIYDLQKKEIVLQIVMILCITVVG